MGNIDFHHLQCCCPGIAHTFGDLVVTSPRELVETKNLLSFPEEDLCLCMSSPGGLWAGMQWDANDGVLLYKKYRFLS